MWGLKRSGNHLLANWLYANFGATDKDPLDADDLHPQLRSGFTDTRAGVAFFNNCGWLHSRAFALGSLQRDDFERAAARTPVTIFGLEDCDLANVDRLPSSEHVTHVLLVRDPLNNIASRLEAATRKPDVFRVDRGYFDLVAAYLAEALGRTDVLPGKVVVNFNEFVASRHARGLVAEQLGITNVDVTDEAVDFGGGSSFGGEGAATPAELMKRFHQRPLPPRFIEQLSARPAVRDACRALFGYDIAELIAS